MEEISAFSVDLNMVEGDGDFPCPSCGASISPDDASGVTYEIIDIETREDGSLKTMSVLCKKCGSKVLLEGFEMLDALDNLE